MSSLLELPLLTLSVSCGTQSNDKYRGPTELVQHSALQGKGATCLEILKLILVWLYRSPIPMGRRGVFYLLLDTYLPSRRLEEGEGAVSTLWYGMKQFWLC